MNIAIPTTFTATVTAMQTVVPQTVALKVATDTPLQFTAGQYASFIIGDDRRPFSFTSVPQEKEPEFLVGYSSQGITKKLIETLKVGSQFTFMAPYGRFIVAPDTRPLLFIATGTGIAPIRSMIQQLLTSNDQRPITLLFGNYTKWGIYYQQEFKKLAETHPQFTYIPSVSEPDSSFKGPTGLVTELAPKLIKQIDTYTAYVCGNPSMVKSTTTMLEKKGLTKEHIFNEQFT